MNYAAMGACPTPYAGYPGYGPYGGYAPFAGPGLAGAYSFDIAGAPPPANAMVGYAPAPPARDPAIGAAPLATVGQDAQPSWFSQPGPLNISRLNWILGAAAIGATWFAYSRGYLGGEPARMRAGDFDFFGRDADFFI